MPDQHGTEGPGENVERDWRSPLVDEGGYDLAREHERADHDEGGPVLHTPAADACSTCAFSAPPVNTGPGAPLQCRRHPPVVALATIKIAALPPGLDIGPQPSEVLQALTNFPAVQPDEWCGEYEPRSARPTAADD